MWFSEPDTEPKIATEPGLSKPSLRYSHSLACGDQNVSCWDSAGGGDRGTAAGVFFLAAAGTEIDGKLYHAPLELAKF